MRSKTLLYILVVIAIIAVAALIAYEFFYHGNTAAAPSVGQTGSLPGVSNQQFPQATSSPVNTFSMAGGNSSSSQFGIVSNDPALDYFVNNANVVTLVRPDGVIESIANNTVTPLSTSTFSDIITASFSHDGKFALLEVKNGTSTETRIFDLARNAWESLPNGMQSPTWSPAGDQVAYLVQNGYGSEILETITIGGQTQTPTILDSFTMEDMSLQWSEKNIIILSDAPSAFVADSIWKFNISSKTLTSVVFEKLAAESIWNASGSALLFFGGGTNSGGTLVLQDPAGDSNTLSFGTLPSKCTFATAAGTPGATSTANASEFIYCAVPNDQNTFNIARLPDEYDQKIYFTNDDFYQIDPVSGSLYEIFSYIAANQNIDATDLKVFDNILFFINRYDQKIYALSL